MENINVEISKKDKVEEQRFQEMERKLKKLQRKYEKVKRLQGL